MSGLSMNVVTLVCVCKVGELALRSNVSWGWSNLLENVRRAGKSRGSRTGQRGALVCKRAM